MTATASRSLLDHRRQLGGAFAIDPVTGAITVANPAALDFETTPVFNLTVQATDGTTPDTAVITINLINANDNAPQINDATTSLPRTLRSAPPSTTSTRPSQAPITTATASRSSTRSPPATPRRLCDRPATGAITVANAAATRLRNHPVFNLTVQATDGVHSTPPDHGQPDQPERERSADRRRDYEHRRELTGRHHFYDANDAFTGADNDRDGQPLTYSIAAGNVGGAFAIDSATGAIKVANSAALDFETTPVFNLTSSPPTARRQTRRSSRST